MYEGIFGATQVKSQPVESQAGVTAVSLIVKLIQFILETIHWYAAISEDNSSNHTTNLTYHIIDKLKLSN